MSRSQHLGRALVVAAVVAPSAVLALQVLVTRNSGATAAGFNPVVVQTRRIAIDGHAGHEALQGPTAVRVHFGHPTRPGTLLVAAVIDGVRTSGMTQPTWHISGWRRGVDMIGGQLATTEGPATGGLQSVILFDPDNRGGVTSVDVGEVPPSTVTWVTVVLAELAGVPQHVHVVARGGSTDGPYPSDYSTFSAVRTSTALRQVPDLVLTSFTNGGTAPHGERFVHSPGWRVLGADRSTNEWDQPILFDERTWRAATKPSEWMRYLGGNRIDNCAAIVALG